MADNISVTGEKPSVKSYEDFDVFNGKGGVSRSEGKAATFHSGSQSEGDAVFNHKAELMEASGSELSGVEKKGETSVEKKEEK